MNVLTSITSENKKKEFLNPFRESPYNSKSSPETLPDFYKIYLVCRY